MMIMARSQGGLQNDVTQSVEHAGARNQCNVVGIEIGQVLECGGGLELQSFQQVLVTAIIGSSGGFPILSTVFLSLLRLFVQDGLHGLQNVGTLCHSGFVGLSAAQIHHGNPRVDASLGQGRHTVLHHMCQNAQQIVLVVVMVMVGGGACSTTSSGLQLERDVVFFAAFVVDFFLNGRSFLCLVVVVVNRLFLIRGTHQVGIHNFVCRQGSNEFGGSFLGRTGHVQKAGDLGQNRGCRCRGGVVVGSIVTMQQEPRRRGWCFTKEVQLRGFPSLFGEPLQQYHRQWWILAVVGSLRLLLLLLLLLTTQFQQSIEYSAVLFRSQPATIHHIVGAVVVVVVVASNRIGLSMLACFL
mmetsp:Transcript_2462/g.6171  ORF Transcript_2462/g.6171 Transcript_2462/m.6171 type:complete len:354 (-) Transcript_2462:245-1306(-)